MQVIFATRSKNQNRYTISNVPGHGKIWFDKGVKSTTDKDLIKKLLNHTLYERGDYELVTNEEMVAKYLEGEYADKLTDELLDNLSLQGVKELGKAIATKSSQPVLIKAEAKGKPITNKVQEILDFYTVKEEERKPVEDKGVEEIEDINSKSMSAADAVDFIENNDPEVLEGFLAENEDRKTVIKAWNSKLDD
jgi:hypothetical protein